MKNTARLKSAIKKAAPDLLKKIVDARIRA
jgi:hypothetical protein